jgi:hypothetical protein
MLILLVDFLLLWVAIGCYFHSFYRAKPRCLGSRISEKFQWQFTFVEGIFNYYYLFLQDSAMKLVHAERNGEAFDSQLVIGKNYFQITVQRCLKKVSIPQRPIPVWCQYRNSALKYFFEFFENSFFRESVLTNGLCFRS